MDFQDITGYSGEFIEAQDLIAIAKTAAAGAMQTTYHEARMLVGPRRVDLRYGRYGRANWLRQVSGSCTARKYSRPRNAGFVRCKLAYHAGSAIRVHAACSEPESCC